MTITLTAPVGEKSPWVLEKDLFAVQGEEINLAVRWRGATSVAIVASDPNMEVWDGHMEVTSLAVPSGNATWNGGEIVTYPPIKTINLEGGKEYVVLFEAFIDGNFRLRKLRLNCQEKQQK